MITTLRYMLCCSLQRKHWELVIALCVNTRNSTHTLNRQKLYPDRYVSLIKTMTRSPTLTINPSLAYPARVAALKAVLPACPSQDSMACFCCS